MAAPSLIPARVEQAIHDRVAAGENPTFVIAVVDGDKGEVHAFGKLDTGAAPTSATIYEIGSVTKTFTATLLANAVDNGQLRLDQPLSKLLPGFSIPSKDGKTITLAAIAEQNSGLPRLPANLAPADPTDPYADYDAAKLKQFLANYTLPRDPGTTYEYSNLAVGLLGYALGQHARSSYPALLKTAIFEPLGMKDTSVAMGKGNPAGMAIGHDASGKAVPNWHFDALAAAGGIRSTGADMLRYLEANMGLLRSPLLPAMQLAQSPRASSGVPDNQIGLIWMTLHKEGGQDVIWHNGMTGGYASFIGFTADRKHGVVILTNAQIGVDDLGLATLRAGWPLAQAHKKLAMSAAELKVYQGIYQLSPRMVLRISLAGDQLLTQATGQQPIPIYPTARDEFFAQFDNITISFKRKADGTVDSLVVHQHGDHPAPKISEATADKVEGISQVTLDTATLQGYLGRYDLAPGAAFVVTIDHGQLMAKLASQPSLPLYASAKDHFFYRVVDAKIDFERDASGRVVALVLHQNGQTKRAPKIGE
nr:serine hydrolase [Rhodanobacter sp. 7MK24]